MSPLEAIWNASTESWRFGALVVAGLLMAVWLANGIYFHYRYQKELDKRVMKERYFDGGLLFNLMRLMMYGHYCLFRKRATRDGVNEIFLETPAKVRFHLIFHWVSLLVAVFIFLMVFVLVRYFGGF